jgi:hypothetical protein
MWWQSFSISSARERGRFANHLILSSGKSPAANVYQQDELRGVNKDHQELLPVNKVQRERRISPELWAANKLEGEPGPGFLKFCIISTCKKRHANAPEINTSKTKDFKSTAMNTCKKMGEGVGSAYLRRFPR